MKGLGLQKLGFLAVSNSWTFPSVALFGLRHEALCVKEHVHGRQDRCRGAGAHPLPSGSVPTAAHGFLMLGAWVALPQGLLLQSGSGALGSTR